MNRAGQWSLSPAFDVTYSYNPDGAWTSQHQLSINGRRNDFDLEDLIQLASIGGIKKRKAIGIIEQATTAADTWELHSDAAEIPEITASKMKNAFRLNFVDSS